MFLNDLTLIMKKSILTIALLTIVLSTYAQLPFTFDLGIKAGINSNQVNTSSATINNINYTNFTSTGKSGFDFGIFARLGGKRLYLQPELLYCQQNGQSGDALVTQNLNLKTIQVPVLLGFKLINLRVASLRAFTGPAMSYVLTSSNLEMNLPNFDPKNLKNNIWNWQLGAGIDILKFTFDIRYSWGLSNTSEGNLNNIGFVNKVKAMTFSVGFKFF